jgi:hypothetical protein
MSRLGSTLSLLMFAVMIPVFARAADDTVFAKFICERLLTKV